MADFDLVLGESDGGEYGNKFNGQTDLDGVVTASFTSTSEDLLLSFTGYDIDNNSEVEILINGVSLGFISAGTNNGFSLHSLTIPAELQIEGENEISFVQAINPNWKWGFTDIVLDVPPPPPPPPPPDMQLTMGEADGGEYGNKFNGQTDSDGIVTAGFTGTTEELTLTLTGYDIDNAAEVEVLVNGVSLGFLSAGANNGFSQHSLTIAADLQVEGDNVISFVQAANPNWKWGVTDVLLELPSPPPPPPPPDMQLTLGEVEGGEYGNRFNAAVDVDGVVNAAFTGATEDVILTFTGYDIDENEIEVLLNGASLGLLTTGANDGLTEYSIVLEAGQQIEGENIISFVQTVDPSWKWGVTDVLVNLASTPPEPDMTLSLGVAEAGEYGNRFNDAIDSDGVVTAVFTGTSEDLLLSFTGYDIDENEIDVLLNGESLGMLSTGANDGLTGYDILIDAADQLGGENIISFVQTVDATWKWGVTDVLLDVPPPPPPPEINLALGVTETGDFGNNYAGQTDDDGMVRAVFSGTTDDLVLTFAAYDVDTDVEIEILVNGETFGLLPAGFNNGYAFYSVDISAASQNVGDNIITFAQQADVAETWGLTFVRLETKLDDAPHPLYGPLYSQQWHLAALGGIETVWADYTGDGVSTGIYDNGIDIGHEDLSANYDASKHPIVLGATHDPSYDPDNPSGPAANHGTSVAGIIAADDNAVGGVGVAFDASITGVNIFSGDTDINAVGAGFADAMDALWTFDVVNHSWGFTPDFDNDTLESSTISEAAFEKAVEQGRGGLGTIIVKSAGNGYDSSQGDHLDTLRYTLTTAAYDQGGDAAWYTNRGANIVVSAPSSGNGAVGDNSIISTDLPGDAGYSPGFYTDLFGGTSAAAPVVSGVVSLMLEANPDLGWRDVREILEYSATLLGGDPDATDFIVADSTGDGIGNTKVEFPVEFFDWMTNGAVNWNGGGLHFSEDYGFGAVNALAAVRMAEAWSLFDAPAISANEVVEYGGAVSPNLDVNRNGAPASVSYSYSFTPSAIMFLEYVDIRIVFEADSLSDISIDLISPTGTEVSLLHAIDALSASGPETFTATNGYLPQLAAGQLEWTFGATAFAGENPDGDWQIVITEVAPDNSLTILGIPYLDLDGGGLLEVDMTFYGSDETVDNVYHYTDEMLLLDLASDPDRVALADDGGSDWFDFAAVSKDVFVDLSGGGFATIDGVTVVDVTAGTAIENAVSGDGDDALWGSADANRLFGMRGDDALYGLAGADLLEGGDGADTLTGGLDDDELWGGAGNDLYVFNFGDGADYIGDFESGDGFGDQIALYGFSFASFDELNFTLDANNDTVLQLSAADNLTFEGESYDFVSEDFLFYGVA